MQGLIGRKIGMTRFFNKESGRQVAVTVIGVGSNVVHQVKNTEKDGYRAVQIGFDICSENKVNKPLQGHFKKHNSMPTRIIKEFQLDTSDEKMEPGQKLGVEIFENVKYVDVTGTAKGRGFAGTIKKYNFERGRETHGNTNHRERGSIGGSSYPSRVFPGIKMAGQYGNEKSTMKGLQLMGIDKEAGLIFVRGSIPGRNKGVVIIRKNDIKK